MKTVRGGSGEKAIVCSRFVLFSFFVFYCRFIILLVDDWFPFRLTMGKLQKGTEILRIIGTRYRRIFDRAYNICECLFRDEIEAGREYLSFIFVP